MRTGIDAGPASPECRLLVHKDKHKLLFEGASAARELGLRSTSRLPAGLKERAPAESNHCARRASGALANISGVNLRFCSGQSP